MGALFELCYAVYTLGFIALTWAYRERTRNWFLDRHTVHLSVRGVYGLHAARHANLVNKTQRVGWAAVGASGAGIVCLGTFSLLRWLARFMF